MYAVVSGSYICICESKNNLEMFRIYIEHRKSDISIQMVLWLGNDAVAVVIENKAILIYRINQSGYNFTDELKMSKVCSTVEYNRNKKNTILCR